MSEPNGLMCVLAHPDDESMALGGTLAMYAAKGGVPTSLVMATRGEQGWHGDPAAYPGPQALGKIRGEELRAAVTALGVDDLVFLGEHDGNLDQIDPYVVVMKIVAEIRRVRPSVVVTFGPDGAYGHPDHIAISQMTTTAVICAAQPEFEDPSGAPPHRVAKLYYRIWTASERDIFESVFGDVGIDVAGTRRRMVAWPNWAVTTRLDTSEFWPQVRDAVFSHRSQVGEISGLARLHESGHRRIWGVQQFVRVMSVVSTGPGLEHDLFAGLETAPAVGSLVRITPNGTIKKQDLDVLAVPA